ncbi:endonuclease [Actinomycetospora sp. NBRC 106375]|uniref:endonuclease/exonuclease/phosphatase family protein n=1 Tax=Actinomycetospora sp. NBRC 106375 TaxID=3032207 RepID=UPI0024A2E35D|nr:endonuclease/exonuclease/phosphatase family protein [Actinomycetospora sp. NBRC 106375]GLZ44473.1 endonuclease [Actinomycetospora sp. NBRC 106375]
MRSRVVGVLLGLAAAVVALWIPFWWWAPAGSPTAFALLPLTPAVAVVAAVVAVLALVLRRWGAGVVAVVAALALAAVVVPRAVPYGDPMIRPGPTSAAEVVATVNLQFGRADPAAVVAMVRERRVGVLGLQEVTPAAERRLDEAGLGAELPFRASMARDGAGGTTLVARHPLAPSGLSLRPGVFSQVAARVLTPAAPVDVVVAHPAAPVFRDDPEGWAREITDLPGPSGLDGPPRLIVGDLNATLDHRPLRELLAGHWTDSARELGDALRGTWPTDRAVPPFAAIDHVLVSGPVTPVDLATSHVPATDHAALVVTVLVSRSDRGVTPGA